MTEKNDWNQAREARYLLIMSLLPSHHRWPKEVEYDQTPKLQC